MSGTRKIKLLLPETLLMVADALAKHDNCVADDVIYCLLTNGIATMIEQNVENRGLCVCLMQACNDIDKLVSRHLPRQEAGVPSERGIWRVQ